jgi:hypothetical protein
MSTSESGRKDTSFQNFLGSMLASAHIAIAQDSSKKETDQAVQQDQSFLEAKRARFEWLYEHMYVPIKYALMAVEDSSEKKPVVRVTPEMQKRSEELRVAFSSKVLHVKDFSQYHSDIDKAFVAWMKMEIVATQGQYGLEKIFGGTARLEAIKMKLAA